MKKNINFKIRHLLTAMLLMTGVAFAFTACSDDDNASNAPAVKKTTSTFNSISFEWATVNGASEYSYRLICDNDGKEIAKASTSATQMTFTDLTPAKTYYLYVAAIIGGTPTEEGRAAAATGFQIAQPATSMKVRLNKDGILETTLSWSATGAEKFGYILDGSGEEVITDKTSLTLPNDLSVTEHTLSIRSISSDALFNNSTAKTYTFTPTGSIYNGNFGSATLNITDSPVTVEAWRYLNAEGKDADKYKVKVDNLLGKTFTYVSTLVKDASSYVLVPSGDGITEMKDKDGKVIGYDFGTINAKPISVTSITVDKSFGTLTVTYAYDAEMKQKETIKVPITAKKKDASKNEL
ncbi:fibronectin type III domain-containing protein [Bacteroides sp.]